MFPQPLVNVGRGRPTLQERKAKAEQLAVDAARQALTLTDHDWPHLTPQPTNNPHPEQTPPASPYKPAPLRGSALPFNPPSKPRFEISQQHRLPSPTRHHNAPPPSLPPPSHRRHDSIFSLEPSTTQPNQSTPPLPAAHPPSPHPPQIPPLPALTLAQRTLAHRFSRTEKKLSPPCLKCVEDGYAEAARDHAMVSCKCVDVWQRRRIDREREESEGLAEKRMVVTGVEDDGGGDGIGVLATYEEVPGGPKAEEEAGERGGWELGGMMEDRR